VIAAWRGGDLKGLQLGGLTAQEALALERLAMTYVRGQLGDRLQRQIARAYRRWLHPTSGRRPGDASCSSGHPQAAAVSTVDSAVRPPRPRFRGAAGHRTLPQPSRQRSRTWPPLLFRTRGWGRSAGADADHAHFVWRWP
jgi:hypothetical protein